MTEAAADYPASLHSYLGGAGESALQQAYQIGRRALESGTSLVAIADIHHACLRKLLAHGVGTAETDRILAGAAQFFAECVSPFEMTYGGFREANTALRHFNEVLEQEAKRIANVLHARTIERFGVGSSAAVFVRGTRAAFPAADKHRRRARAAIAKARGDDLVPHCQRSAAQRGQAREGDYGVDRISPDSRFDSLLHTRQWQGIRPRVDRPAASRTRLRLDRYPRAPECCQRALTDQLRRRPWD